MHCVACGRELTNDDTKPNLAHWTPDPYGVGGRVAYCADSADCQRDAEQIIGAT
jgi:hypothetical protein